MKVIKANNLVSSRKVNVDMDIDVPNFNDFELIEGLRVFGTYRFDVLKGPHLLYLDMTLFETNDIDDEKRDDNIPTQFRMEMKNVKCLKVKLDLVINDRITYKETLIGEEDKSLDDGIECRSIFGGIGYDEDEESGEKKTTRLQSLYGNVNLEFEPLEWTEKSSLKDEFIRNMYEDQLNVKDFDIICQGEKFKFSKSLLCNVSEVFKDIIENPTTEEVLFNKLTIVDFSPETLRTFTNLICKDDVSEKEITLGLFLFAQKYQITALVKICETQMDHLITLDNLLELIKASYLLDNPNVYKAVSKFIHKMDEIQQENVQWIEFKKNHLSSKSKIVKKILKYSSNARTWTLRGGPSARERRESKSYTDSNV